MATLDYSIEARTRKEYKEDNTECFEELDQNQQHKEDHNQKSKQRYEKNKDKAKEQRKERHEHHIEMELGRCTQRKANMRL